MDNTFSSTINLEQQDDSTLSRIHWRIILTAGMGFFTDAYDLFVIGVVTSLLTIQWHLTLTQLALLNGASLLAAAFGAIFFGTLADKFGRKKMYGYEIFILFWGALFSAIVPNYTILLITRIIMGFGIGGDYPSSAVVASEYAHKRNRGFVVLLVFAMQAVGLMVGPSIAALLLSVDIPYDIAWRVLLALGAIPAAVAYYLRRRISETPHFRKIKELPLESSHIVHDLAEPDETPAIVQPIHRLLDRKWLQYLIATSLCWFILDVAFYGNSVSSLMIFKYIDPNASIAKHCLLSAGIFFCFAFPGYLMAAKFVDIIGRKLLQLFGFCMMGACFIVMAIYNFSETNFIAFIALFGMSFFFVNFGPNTTTFLIPSEIFPTAIRAVSHGISAAVGKLGAFVGVFFMPILLHYYGLNQILLFLGSICILGALLTLLLPEMKQQQLE